MGGPVGVGPSQVRRGLVTPAVDVDAAHRRRGACRRTSLLRRDVGDVDREDGDGDEHAEGDSGHGHGVRAHDRAPSEEHVVSCLPAAS